MNSRSSTGKRKISRTIIIPISRQIEEKETTQILLLNCIKESPKAIPNKPVVKGKQLVHLAQ